MATRKRRPKMVPLEGFKVHSVTFQRNGIGGRAFHVVVFAFGLGEGRVDRLIGIVPTQERIPDLTECYVIDPANLEMTWRGDSFDRELRAAVARFKS